MDVDPVQQGAGDPPLVLADLLGRAAAGAAPVAEVTAGALIRSPFLNFFSVLIIPRLQIQQDGYPKSPKSIGGHIRKRRMDLRLLQRNVADMIGVSECTIYNWENDGSQPATQYIPGIIDFLGYVPFECPEDILGRLAYFKRIKGLTFHLFQPSTRARGRFCVESFFLTAINNLIINPIKKYNHICLHSFCGAMTLAFR